MSAYKPGLHILSSFSSDQVLLSDADSCRSFFDTLIVEFGLQKVGEAWHTFPNGGFTAVICLTESHLSIHTWPEAELATFDVFLSNYTRDNGDKVQAIYGRTILHFGAVEQNKHEIRR